jgi:arsenate reductase
MIKVLFVCVHNSSRSQMAEEYLRLFGGDRFQVESAGLEPGTINPVVAQALLEDGIDISGKKTRGVQDLYREGKTYRFVITVCSREAEEKCPIFPGAVVRYNWPFEDPSKFSGSPEVVLEKTRIVREAVKMKIREFIDTTAT